MRIAILSDVHGNLPALEAVLEDLKIQKPDGLIVAGDFVGGPHPNETIELLRSWEPNWMILGNSDINILRYMDHQVPPAYPTAKQFALLRWGSTHISPEALKFLRDLPQQQVISADGMPSIRVVHGSLDDPFDGYDPDFEAEKLDDDLGRLEEKVLICGHTHRPWIIEKKDKLALNPGSVAGPLNGYVGTQYAILDWVDGQWKAQLRALRYDLARLRADFLENGLLESGGALAQCFLRSNETGEDVSRRFLQFVSALSEQTESSNGSVIPDEIWDLAAATFDWEQWN